MKATGIVRRIDDLGRVVIPKEIRRTMHIREGAPLEIFTSDEGDVIFRKYSPLGEFPQTSAQCVEALFKVTKYPAFVCDRERIVSATGLNRRELKTKRVSQDIDRLMQTRAEIAGERNYTLTDDMPDTVNIVVPIVSSSDVIGCVAMSAPVDYGQPSREIDKKYAEIAASFLGRQIEE